MQESLVIYIGLEAAIGGVKKKRKTPMLEFLYEKQTLTQVLSYKICGILRKPILKNICERLLL